MWVKGAFFLAFAIPTVCTLLLVGLISNALGRLLLAWMMTGTPPYHLQ